MTWTNFLLTLLFIYLLYYGLNLAYDLLLAGKQPRSPTTQEEFIFLDDYQPELMTYDESEDIAPVFPGSVNQFGSGALIPGLIGTTGGVSMVEMFNLAKDDLIEFTKGISF
jgi:hypothetical protein